MESINAKISQFEGSLSCQVRMFKRIYEKNLLNFEINVV